MKYRCILIQRIKGRETRLATCMHNINTTSKLGLPSNPFAQYSTSAVSWTEASYSTQVRVDMDALERNAAYSLVRKSDVSI